MAGQASPLRIVLAVSGGIAAYKAVSVVRLLAEDGHDIRVIATDSALKFVGAPTFEAVSHHPVHTSVFDDVSEVEHVALGQSADVVAVVPATAATLSRLASGLADDLVGTTVLASRAPLVLAPAMHTEMWQHPATQHNMSVLKERGALVVGPVSGRLTGADSGLGRLAEPSAIAEAITRAARLTGDWAGRTVTVSAGGTREPIDPVRYIGNRSSGRQGIALAEAARDRGASVRLIACNISADVPADVSVEHVSSTQELAAAVTEASDGSDVVIMAAAVADYRPAAVADQKVKRDHAGSGHTLELVQNPDIVAGLAQKRRQDQVIVAFAAETEPDPAARLELGRAKRERKGSDYLVLNHVGWSEGFGNNDNSIVVIDSRGVIVKEAAGSKRSVADAILDAVAPSE